MASPKIYYAGLNLAGTVFSNGPATLQLSGATYFSGGIQWLDTINGDDSDAGVLPELPVRTLAQAVTNSATNGIIVIGAGSSETLGSSQSLNILGLSIFGCGTGSSRPRYTCSGAVSMFSVIGGSMWIEGLYFPASTAAPTARVDLNAGYVTVKDCYFECGTNDTAPALLIDSNSDGAHIDGCSFVTTASRPSTGLEVAAAISDVVIDGCTFDGGSYGWSDYALKVSAAATRMTIRNPTFTNRSDLGVTVTATSYRMFGVNMGGTGNVLLTA